MRLFGLIGNPLTHSFSKDFFTEKFRKEGLADCRYDLFPLPDIDALTELLENNPSLEGLNVTIPYKREVIPFLDDVNFLPPGLNACNCIKISQGRLIGYNTDVTGFEKSFTKDLRPDVKKALILGTGGASEAVSYVLSKLGIEHLFVSRNPEGSQAISYDDVGKNIDEYKIIINTTPLGTYPKVNEFPPIPYERIGKEHYLFDVVYNPERSLFLQKGKDRGARTRNGREMLEVQAEESWKIWKGDNY